MKRITQVLMCLVFFGLAGLALADGQKNTKSLNMVEWAKGQIRHNSNLYDGESARFRNIRQIDDSLICGEVNAKNRYGAYIGYSEFSVIKDGKSAVITIADGDGQSTICTPDHIETDPERDSSLDMMEEIPSDHHFTKKQLAKIKTVKQVIADYLLNGRYAKFREFKFLKNDWAVCGFVRENPTTGYIMFFVSFGDEKYKTKASVDGYYGIDREILNSFCAE